MSDPAKRRLWWEDRPDLGTGGVFAPLPPAILETDLTITTFRDSSPETTVTITHRPTDLRVSGKGTSQIRLKQRLMEELTILVGNQKAQS